MTAPEVLYSIILALISAVLSLLLSRNRRDAAALFAFIQISWWGRWAFNYLNYQLQFFSQKDASEFSLGLINQPDGVWSLLEGGLAAFLKLKFFIEAFVNIPALRLLEESIYILNMTNGFFGAMSGLLVFAYFQRLFDTRIATIGLIFASIYPAAVAFSFFALRDIFMYFFLLMNVCSFTWIFLRSDYKFLNWFIYIFSAVAAVACRTELILFVIVMPGWIILTWMLHLVRMVEDRAKRMFVVACLAIAIPATGLAVGYPTYILAIRKLGFTSFVSPTALMSNYAADRLSRGQDRTGSDPFEGSGHGSDFLPVSVYNKTPVPIRVLVQCIGMIVIPMPWQLTSPSRIFGFLDSIFVITLMIWSFRSRKLFRPAKPGQMRWIPPAIRQYDREKFHTLTVAILLTFVLDTIGFGIVVSNGGNAFRMRLCMVPYIVMGATLYASANYAWIGGRFVKTREFLMSRLRRGSAITSSPAGQ